MFISKNWEDNAVAAKRAVEVHPFILQKESKVITRA